ncbi:MAG: nicotinate-nucleotide--dimethylbenzimidazole phosphoribosyltransferase [Anaerolineales bacterium]|nr:nicotinate-nucleotide--dimethylbenzimidazole phosphoribosyltransferase [Anaerolineales bacterium]MCB8965839.1 nicotinate-nucleotide--dimethylbenzimidazole phosphoribosyltransferase [Ardenticatenaceae bacterium]
MSLENLLSRIKPLNQGAMDAARQRQAILTKPAGSLGRLEELSIQIAGITGQPLPQITHKMVTVMAGDHGVVAEGVSAYPAEVTPQMVFNFLAGGAAVNVLARQAGARVVIVDMGVAVPLEPHPSLIDKKVAPGTNNIAQGPAMSREQAIQAILAGASVVEAEAAQGLDLLATGDMGIGNTTPSAAIAAVLTGESPVVIVGRGTGVDDAGLQRKVTAVQKAITVNQPDAADGLDVLMKVGGYEIAGLAGAILAAAANGCPIVVDGFISTAAAMIAAQICPTVRQYLIAGHCSEELGHRLMLNWLGLKPLLDLNLRLGEGTGAVLAMSLVEAACRTLVEMATFADAGVSEKMD